MDDQQNSDGPGDDLSAIINRMDPLFDGSGLAAVFADQYSAVADAMKTNLQPQLNSISLAACESWETATASLNDLVGVSGALEWKGSAGLDMAGTSIAEQLAETINTSGLPLGETISFDSMFESIAGAWKSQFDGVATSVAESLMEAVAPMHALTDWADSMNLAGLAEMGLAETSAAAEIAKTLELSSGSALREMAGITSTLDLVGLLAAESLNKQMVGIDDLLPTYEAPAVLLASQIELPDFDLIGNPLLTPVLELAQSNAAMARRIDEQTELIREMRDEMAGLRQRQVESDLRQAESEKGAHRWVRRDVGIAFAALIVAIVLGILGL